MRYQTNHHRLGRTDASWLMQMFLAMLIMILAVDLTRRFVSLHNRAMAKQKLSSVPPAPVESTNAASQTKEIVTVPMTAEIPKLISSRPAANAPAVVPPVELAPLPPPESLPEAVLPINRARAWGRPMHRGLDLPPGMVSLQYFNPQAFTLVSVPVDEAESGVPTGQEESLTGKGEAPVGVGFSTAWTVGFPPGKGDPKGKGASEGPERPLPDP